MKDFSEIGNRTDAQAETKNIHILYVDDDRRNLRVFNLIFKKKFKIFQASSAEAALEILAKEEIHIIIADQAMPNVKGTELLADTYEQYPHIVRIVLSGFKDSPIIRDATIKFDIFQCIDKPFRDEELMKVFIQAYRKYKENVATIEPEVNNKKRESA